MSRDIREFIDYGRREMYSNSMSQGHLRLPMERGRVFDLRDFTRVGKDFKVCPEYIYM